MGSPDVLDQVDYIGSNLESKDECPDNEEQAGRSHPQVVFGWYLAIFGAEQIHERHSSA